VPLQEVSEIVRVGLEELHLVMESGQILKVRLPAGTPIETMQRWFDQIVV